MYQDFVLRIRGEVWRQCIVNKGEYVGDVRSDVVDVIQRDVEVGARGVGRVGIDAHVENVCDFLWNLLWEAGEVQIREYLEFGVYGDLGSVRHVGWCRACCWSSGARHL